MKRKEERSSRFQKEAQKIAEEKKQDQLKSELLPSKSRFTEMAKQKAEKRALKQELQEQRLHRSAEED